MTGEQAAVRQQQQTEELCGAALRALSADPGLRFRGHRLYRGRRPVPAHAPHLRPSPEDDDFGSFRGATDGLALRLTESEAATHEELRPEDPVERMVFDMLEQFRAESRVPDTLPGVRSNLRHRFTQWSLACERAGLLETARGLLLFTVAQVCRSRITGQPVADGAEDTIESTRYALAPRIGDALAGLRRDRADQRAFAPHARAIAATVAGMLATLDDEGTDEDQDDAEDQQAKDRRTPFALFMDLDAGGTDDIATAGVGDSRTLAESADGYRVFTTAYDRERDAGRLVRGELLRELREQLDRRIAGQGVNVPRLARELKALLAEPARDGWDGGQEEGYVDSVRLAQLVASPTDRRIFRTVRTEPVADALVTFLIDCSGSMKEHAESVAMLVDVFARALDQAEAACEILGFTTGAWNGGRAKKDWLRAGRPPHPGRLNEQCHLVFKDAGTPWRRARRDISALLKPDLFREGVDGEAVAWACRRAEERSEGRRLLIVISDGSPMDTATNLANDRHYLDHHLREVVLRQEVTGPVEIYGVGVGLDLSPYYRRSRVLDLSRDTGNACFREVLDLIR